MGLTQIKATALFGLNTNNNSISPMQIRNAINSMQFAQIENNGEMILINTRLDKNAKMILKTLGIKQPENATLLKDYLI